MFNRSPIAALLGLVMAAVSGAACAQMKPARLRCEYLEAPLGVEAAKPRLSWELTSTRRAEVQTAYRVMVARDESTLKSGQADLWDSGKVASSQTAHVEYSGKPLESGQACWWRVQVWDREGKMTESLPAKWEMGLLKPSDWHGKWIARTTNTSSFPAPHLRKEFEVKGRVKRARLYISGLAYCEPRLNGKKLGDALLDPGYTRFDRRALYVVHDATEQIKQGKNVIGAILGNGWLNVHTKAVWYFDRAPWRVSPRMIAELRIDLADGKQQVIGTDGTWKTSEGPITYDSIYGGETYDARKELGKWDEPGYDDRKWIAAMEVPSPGGKLAWQPCPPIRVTDTLNPAKLTQPRPGVWIFDLGQNFAGHARLRLRGKAGEKVTLRYGERLHPDGTLDTAAIDMHMTKKDPAYRFQTDEYIQKGAGFETWEARFTYHGFQYVEVTGYPGKPTLESLEGVVHNTDVKPAGEFSCSNPLLNRIQAATLWSYRSNLQSIPTDCPHREKNGWTGDAHLASEQGMLNFDSPTFYTKWLNDLKDEMRPTGELPGIVPSSGWGYEWGNGPAWDSAYVLIPWYLYQYYGDTRILAEHYPTMKRYVDYLTSKANQGIVSIGLGDWVPAKTETPVPVTSTGYYYKDACIVRDAARILGYNTDVRHYDELTTLIRQAFAREFVDDSSGSVANNSQTALSTALYQGVGQEQIRSKVFANLVADVERQGKRLDCGILGTKYLLHALSEGGRLDLAYAVASQTLFPSWGNWIEQGATVLWEAWNGADSRNHIMFGDISHWFYRWVAGIRPLEPGFKKVEIVPGVVGDLTWAKASHHSIHGPISVEWRKTGNGLELDMDLPANVSAVVHIPATSVSAITESGKPVDQAPGVKFLGFETSGKAGVARFEVGSGRYRFGVEK